MKDSFEENPKIVILGQIGKVYGIKGWLKLSSFTSPSTNIFDYTELMVRLGDSVETLKIDEYKERQNGLIVHFSGYDNPDDSKKLVGKQISIENDRLPQLLDGEFYWHELEALEVVNQEGYNLGQVANLIETGANDVLVVKPSDQSWDKRERLIPFVKETVIKKVDVSSKKIEVDWGVDFLE